MKLTEMRQILASGQIQLTKSLGQNFLHDGNQLRRIVEAAALTKTDKVLEIGPGLGPLTELLVAEAGEVLAIEKDRRLFEFLQQRFADVGNLALLCDDALDYLQREQRDWSDWKLVANLPYSVASPILVELAQADVAAGVPPAVEPGVSPGEMDVRIAITLENSSADPGGRMPPSTAGGTPAATRAPGSPQRIVATLQLEVAQRLVAQAGDDDYGVLSLLMQLRYEPLGNFKIPADCFFPAPDVDSACVILARRKEPLLPPEMRPTFVKIVKRAFSQRRKMMLKLLKQDWPKEKLEAAFVELKISPQERAEKVSLEQFVGLAKILGNQIA